MRLVMMTEPLIVASRAVSGTSCENAARALAVVVALVMDPSARVSEEPPAEPATARDTKADGAAADRPPLCPCCGGHMIIIEIFERVGMPRGPPSPKADTGT